ncbi:MAG TPA: hypothetical protein VJB96_05065 [Patescibacteria group bacterium]|nr:hypothetical protein [Patescibacteria group bacterium]
MQFRWTKETAWVGCIIAVFLTLTLWEPIYALFRKPPDTIYTYVHNWPEDYFYYLHIMRQGYDGSILVTSRMTTEAYKPQFAVPFYTFLGLFGRVSGISLEKLYGVTRFLGAVGLISVIFLLIRALFRDRLHRLWALVLTLSGTYLPVIRDGVLKPPDHAQSWSELDPLVRLSFVPHHLWSKVLFVGLLYVIAHPSRFVVSNHRLFPVLAGLSVIVMGFISPVILITFGLTVALFWAGEWMFVRRDNILLIGCVGGATAVLMGYHWNLSHSTFPWTTYGPPWEANWLFLMRPDQYAWLFGPLLPLALFGIGAGFRKDPLVRILTSWIVSGWLLLFVFRPLLPFSNTRYISGYQWIAVGILAAQGLVWIGKKMQKRLRYDGFLVLTVLAALLSLPSWYASVRNATRSVDSNLTNPRMFMPLEIRAILSYFENLNGSPCIVAAPDWFSTMIPAYSSCRSVSGHRLMTYANDIKVYEMNEFFFQPKPLAEKAARIKQYGITHVITLDGITGTDILPLLAPTPVFTAGGVRVYEVR